MNKDGYNIYSIPANFSSGISIMGHMFGVRNVIEAAAAALITGGIIFLFRPLMGLAAFVAMELCAVILCAVIVLPGIKGVSFLEYLKLMAQFKKSRRVLIYNPRVKKEATPASGEELVAGAELPRDRILAAAQRIVPKDEETDMSIYSQDNIVFADDAVRGF